MAESDSPLQLSCSLPAQILRSPSSLIPRKVSSNFLLHKAICFSLVVALLSILPSQAATRSILATAWEILHLLFLGVAISYGLFSHRNADFDAVKETATALKAKGSVSYCSNMFHLSSVFEDGDGDGDDDELYYLHGSLDETKTQVWSSQYQRNDPVVVVADESAGSRPLFLPVRSLKSHLHDLDSAPEMENAEPLDSTNAQGEIFEMEMEMEEEEGSSKATRVFPPPPPPLSPSSPDDLSNISKISSFRSYKKRGKPPPAPPPPPPFPCYGFPSTAEKKITKQSFKDELKDLSRRVRKSGRINTDIVFDLFQSATKPGGSSVPRSCRTTGAKDVKGTAAEDAPKIDTEKAVIAPPSDSGKEEEEEVEASVMVEKSSQFGGGDGNEVDKKADEFIAKFRKQITLQRLEAARQAAK
ncbi:uncharacterized protein LOC121991492 [Zingiber officinale]|uniref:Uncharacterized protein n=1 Tax=Zingiber officinale TaxID=94328 RepID=A0A8J5G8F0_ZINOF|nr:uncharacterized protein LOC121991492 [Zingiber officinale]KAG6497914.1 hypothetical protein ZIOFF_045820 [Zingiber officinale]